MNNHLPPGQYESQIFPRFGLSQYANRFPTDLDNIKITLGGDSIADTNLSVALTEFPRAEQTSDFHCVTTWSKSAQVWKGIKSVSYTHLTLPTTPYV